MKRLVLSLCLGVVLCVFSVLAPGSVTAGVTLSSSHIKAGHPVGIQGTIPAGEDLVIVVCTEALFSGDQAPGPKERDKLRKMFGNAAVPPQYYILTNRPEHFATPRSVFKGQTKGPFAFPPFKYQVRANKLKKWNELPDNVRRALGPIRNEQEWDFLRFTHEDSFGINTVTKERPIGGGNARLVLSDGTVVKEAWNKGVALSVDTTTGEFSAQFTPYRNIPPDTVMAVYVNGERAGTFTVMQDGYYFATAGTYMNPLVVVLGAFVIGCLFVIMGAAGGLFTAAFQITVLGTKGPLGINAANTIKPTNLFLTFFSPLTGLVNYFKERRFAWPPAVFFAVGILVGAFWFGPAYSAKYLPMKAYKFYLGIVCLLIGVKLFHESLPGSIAKKKEMKAIVRKFDEAVRKAKESGTAVELGKVEFDRFSVNRFEMRFWGETFVARPLLMLAGGIFMGMIAASFGVGGGFMFMPFMTTLLGYPMYLAVPIALAGTFATSVGGITKYVLMGYQPDWLMAVGIAVGAIGGGMVGPRIQKKLPEVFLKRTLALALILVFLKYTEALPFLR